MMNKNQIRINNKLICEFMGIELYRLYPNNVTKDVLIKAYMEDYEEEPTEAWIEPLRYIPNYDSSWDLLIPVIQKCFDVNRDSIHYLALLNALMSLDKEQVWLRIVSFIKIYNLYGKSDQTP